MIEVIPAVLAKDISDLRNKIANFVSVSRIVQIDMCDGHFVPSRSWPMDKNDAASVAPILEEEEGLPYWDSLDFEFDLMNNKKYRVQQHNLQNSHQVFQYKIGLVLLY